MNNKSLNLNSAISNVLEGSNNTIDNIIIDLELGKIMDEEGLSSEYALLPGEDATLTTKQRKSLKSGTFCGPNRSFLKVA